MVNKKKDPALETFKIGTNIVKKIAVKSSDNLKQMKENQDMKKLEKRYEIEQYTIAKLPQSQAVKYRTILDTIDHNFDILEDKEATAIEKAKSRGRIKALRKARNEIEEPYTKKSPFAKSNNKISKKQKDNNNNKNQNSDDMFGELGKLFEPYNEKHHR